MKIKLKDGCGKKEYHSGELTIMLGDEVEVSDKEAKYLLDTFPEWFEVAKGAQPKENKSMVPDKDK